MEKRIYKWCMIFHVRRMGYDIDCFLFYTHFRQVLRLQQNWAEVTVSHILSALTCRASLIISTYTEFTLTRHYHTKSVVSFRVHSWCVHSMDLNPFIMTCLHYIEQFHCSKNPLCSAYLSLPLLFHQPLSFSLSP